jgi:2-methylisocitrate lyase-like PEP mutase family enzyme
MTSRRDAFLALHVPGTPLLIPNPWDAGSARLLASLGARALATTSSAFAATLGHADGDVTRDQVLAHARALVEATDLPVSADLENGYGDDLDTLAETYRLAAATGLAGASIEDYTGSADDPLYPLGVAGDRVAAARAAAPDLVLTGRAEGYLHGQADLGDVIARLRAYAEAGADVLYAPGLTDAAELATVVREVPRPVNALLMTGMTVPAIAAAGAARISVGGALGWIGWGAVAAAARDFLSGGADWLTEAAAGRAVARDTLG